YQLALQGPASTEGARATRDLILEFGLVPCRLSGACDASLSVLPPALTIVTSMFLHGGLLHLGGNMLYLWIFGDNVEDTLGHGRFLIFFLSSGVIAAVAQVALSASSSVPMIGASGAVSGVLGAYLLLFPRAHVLTLVVVGFFSRLIRIPAILVLGFVPHPVRERSSDVDGQDQWWGGCLVCPPRRLPGRDRAPPPAPAPQAGCRKPPTLPV